MNPQLLPGGDSALAAAVESGNLPTLVMVASQLSGDFSMLNSTRRPTRMAVPFDEGIDEMTPDEQRAIRTQVLNIIRAWRDRGAHLPPLPSADRLVQMMSYGVGEPIPDEYVPMLLSDMGFEIADHAGTSASPTQTPAETASGFNVIVIGAGASGLLAAIKLREAGIEFTLIEKNPSVGGTWFENTYPDCRVDTPNHFYSYSFEPNHDWSCYYSPQPELLQYLEHCANKYQISSQIRFNTEVLNARFDQSRAQWCVTVLCGNGRHETLTANALICAVGQLNQPKLPVIEAMDCFQGPAFHSARWDHRCKLKGKRVAVIGTGASAMQIVRPIADEVAKLTIFQRSAQWAIHNPFYHRRVSDGKKWLLKHLPYYASWYRFRLFWGFSDALLPSLKSDPSWPHPERSMNARNDQHRRIFMRHIEQEIGDDAALLAKVRPDYPPFGKRMLIDNHWYQTLKRAHVDLVTDRILRIDTDAIVTEHERIDTDVIVYATGFHADRLTWPMEIIGRDGRSLAKQWGADDPRAYLGICVPGFPNFFLMYGPNTNLAHGGSIIFHTECQTRYIMGCLQTLRETGRRELECRQQVHDAYNTRLDRAHEQLVWTHPGMNNWYRNKLGRIFSVSPWRLVDYWNMTQRPVLSDFEPDPRTNLNAL